VGGGWIVLLNVSPADGVLQFENILQFENVLPLDRFGRSKPSVRRNVSPYDF
jgi:hypothetical protein